MRFDPGSVTLILTLDGKSFCYDVGRAGSPVDEMRWRWEHLVANFNSEELFGLVEARALWKGSQIQKQSRPRSLIEMGELGMLRGWDTQKTAPRH